MITEAGASPARSRVLGQIFRAMPAHLDRARAANVNTLLGFRIGARYRSSDEKERKYTTLYIVDDEETMSTPELAEIRGFEHLTPYVRYERRIYRPISSYARDTRTLVRY